jgi:hypothetical protein
LICRACIQARQIKRAKDVRQQLLGIMNRYKHRIVSCGRDTPGVVETCVLPCVVDIKQGQMIAVRIVEFGLLLFRELHPSTTDQARQRCASAAAGHHESLQAPDCLETPGVVETCVLPCVVDIKQGQMIAVRIVEFGLLAKVLIASVDSGCSDEMLSIVAMLSIQSVFYRPKVLKPACFHAL